LGGPTSKPDWLEVLGTLAVNQWTLLSGAYAANQREAAYQSGVSKLKSSGNVQDQFSPTSSSSSGQATTTNDDFGYRVPYLEDYARYARASISLTDQSFTQFMAGQTLPYLEAVFGNELDSIDMAVCRLQIAVLDTILMSPISGTVTGIYKKPGDFVRAGEPVVRIEDSSTVLLVAKLKYDGPIVIGATATIHTGLFEAVSDPIVGMVVAVRGQSEDDQWDVIIQYDQMAGALSPVTSSLPLGYRFDYENTTVSFS
jgi:hypothetical protein